MKDLGNLLHLSIEGLRDPIFILDGEGRCVFVNRSFRNLIALSDSSATFMASSFWPKVGEERWSETELSAEFISTEGTTFPVRITVTQLIDGYKFLRVTAGSPKKEALGNLHSQRLETLGMLAGGVAHDFNNILTGILGHISYLKTILPSLGPHTESLSAIEDGSRKASSIIAQILSFSKLDTEEKASVLDLGDLVTRTCMLLRGAISPEYNFHFRVPKESLPICAVEGKLAQVIVNLVINARDAIESDGFVEVSLERVREWTDEQATSKELDTNEHNYVRLSVVDNGHGMSEDVLQRMFEPYFSTKGNRGTGLGLSTVAAIVRTFGGALKVVSRVGMGTTMHVYLPLAENQENESLDAPQGFPQLQGGNERILVVDDEYPVRNVLGVSLEHLGYKVEMAASGLEAIEKFKEMDGAFDLVILDMLMPHLSGDEVFFRLQKINPQVRALLISGYSSEEVVRFVLQNGGRDFIQKPFTIGELSKKVRKCLDG